MQAIPQQSNIDQAHHMQEQQIINEETSSLEVPERHRGKAKKSYAEFDLVSRESLECVSPAKPDDEVIIIISYKPIILVILFLCHNYVNVNLQWHLNHFCSGSSCFEY
jgi:hypothetical protein